MYYANSREVRDFKRLKSLIIADKIKSDLPNYILRDVNREEVKSFLEYRDLGNFSDRCVTNQDEFKSLNNFTKKPGGSPKIEHKKARGVCFGCGSKEHYASDPRCPSFKNKSVEFSGMRMG